MIRTEATISQLLGECWRAMSIVSGVRSLGYQLMTKQLVRIDVEVSVSDVVVRVPISDGGVMGRTYGYSDGSILMGNETYG